LIACLRRVQEWSFVSILSEFRQNTWPNRLFDFEQMIESFNIKSVNTAEHAIPDYLAIHNNLKVIF
jgi:hypothetical protein